MDIKKFEKLIDLVINEDNERANELFHEICVEKSREIYENILSEDFTTEAEEDEEMDESAEKTKKQSTKQLRVKRKMTLKRILGLPKAEMKKILNDYTKNKQNEDVNLDE